MKILLQPAVVPPPPPPPPPTVDILGLSMDEAEALLSIVSRVGGEPAGPRAVVDKLISGLRSAGVQWDFERRVRRFCLNGSLEIGAA